MITISKNLLRIFFLIVLFSICLINAYSDTTIVQWRRRSLDKDITVYGKAKINPIYMHKTATNKWFFKGNDLELYSEGRDNRGIIIGGNLSTRVKDGNKISLANGDEQTKRIELRVNRFGWSTDDHRNVTLISDSHAPSVSFNTDKINSFSLGADPNFNANEKENAKYLIYDDVNNQLIFNPNIPHGLVLYYNGASDGDPATSSGVQYVKLYKLTPRSYSFYKDALTSGGAIDIDKKETDITYSLIVADNVNNGGQSPINIKVLKDDQGPSFSLSSAQYLDNDDGAKEGSTEYKVILNYGSFSDNITGVRRNSFNVQYMQNGVWAGDIGPDSGEYVVTVSNLNRDVTYPLHSSILDNVSNSSGNVTPNYNIALTAKARLDAGATTVNGEDIDKTRFEYNSSGDLYIKGVIDVGALVQDTNAGLNAISINVIDNSSSAKNLNSTYVPHASVNNREITFNNKVDTTKVSLSPHGTYTIQTVSTYKNERYGAESNNHPLTIPNRPLDGAVLNLDHREELKGISLKGKSVVIPKAGNYHDNVKGIINSNTNNLYYIKSDNINSINSVKDVDNDDISFSLFNYGDYKYIIVSEKYNEKGISVEHNYLLTGYKFQIDDVINTEDLNLNIAKKNSNEEYRLFDNKNYVTSSNNISINLSLIPDEINQSGIKKINIFNVPESSSQDVKSIGDYYIANNETNGFYELELQGADLNTVYRDFSLDYVDNLMDRFVYVSARLEDYAGNVVYIPCKKVLIDRKSPPVLTAKHGIISVNNQNNNNDVSYRYSDNSIEDIITLTVNKDFKDNSIIDSPLPLNQLLDRVSLINAPDYVVDSKVLDGGIVEIKLDLTNSSYTPNEKVDIDIKLIDKAGNSTISSLDFYTPGKVVPENITYNRFHNRGYSLWDENKKNYIAFTAEDTEISKIYKDVNVYRNGVFAGTNSFEDIKLGEGHRSFNYTFKSVNNSGFENNRSGTHFNQNITIGNNSPNLTILMDRLISVAPNSSDKYLGPHSVINYNVDDYDVTDSHIVNTYIKDDGYFDYSNSVPQETPKVSFANIYSGKDRTLINGESYNLKIGVVDSWGTDENIESGVEVSRNIDFIYDSEPPAITKKLYEKGDGFSYSNGDLYIKIVDTAVGINPDNVIIEAKADFKDKADTILATELSDNPEFTHKVILVEGEYNIVIKGKDRLENETVLLDEPIKVDHTIPVVKSIIWGDNPNLIVEKNLLSNNLANFKITWEDSVSSPSEILYRFLDIDGSILSSNEVNVRGMSQSSFSGVIDLPTTNKAKIWENFNYILEVEVVDSAGNRSGFKPFGANIKYDINKPVISFNKWNTYNFGGVSYVNTEALPEFDNLIVTDSVDPNPSFIFKVEDQEYTSLSDIVLTEEKEYELVITAIDESGHSFERVLPFTYDVTPPENLEVEFKQLKKNIYKGGETVLLEFVGNSVLSYSYKLIEEGTNQLLTSEYPGADNGWISISEGAAKNYPLILPRNEDSQNQRVLLYIKAKDNADNESEEKLASNFYIDNTGEYINVKVSPWVGLNREIRGEWEYFPGENNDDGVVNSYNYSLYLVRDGVEIELESGITENYSVKLTAPEDFKDNDIYYIKVSAMLSSSRISETFSSVFSYVDKELPVISTIFTDDYASNKNINIDWDVYDNRGVNRVKAVVSWFRYIDQNGKLVLDRSYSQAIDLGNKPVGKGNLSQFIDIEKIKTGDKVEISLIVEDIAGNTDNGLSSIIVIDNSAPPEFSIVDQGDYINPDLNNLYFDWIASVNDPDSPVVNTSYQLTVNGSIDNSSWISFNNSNDLVASVPETMVNGSIVVLAVKKTNAAGLSTTGFSNGIMIDNTAGKIENGTFTLREDSLVDNPETELLHFTDSRDLTLWIDGYDEESGVTRIVAELGYFENSNWIKYENSGVDTVALDGKIDITLPDIVGDNERFRYKLVWYNGTETASQPFYTKALVYNPAPPEINRIEAFYTNGFVSVNWNSSFNVPFMSGKIYLYDGNDIEIRYLEINSNSGLISLSTDTIGQEIIDGSYKFKVELYDLAFGAVSRYSNIFVKDTMKPELTSLEADPFVASSLSFKLEANENISNYSYTIGTIDNNSAFTKEWVEGITSGSIIKKDGIDLTLFNNLESIDQDYMLITIRFSDVYGNWSDPYEALVRVDFTPPTTPVVSKDREVILFDNRLQLDKSISFSSSDLSDILYSSDDPLSGIKGYKWIIVKSFDKSPITNWSDQVSVNDGDNFRVNFTGLSFNNDNTIIVGIKSINGAGVESETGYSEEIVIDLEAPEAHSDAKDSKGFTKVGNDNIDTYNSSGVVNLVVDNEDANIMYYEVKLVDYNGNEVDKSNGFINSSINNIVELNYQPTPEDYGVYTMNIDLWDPGMYKKSIIKKIRYNSPPFPVLPDKLTVNPGRPFTIKADSWFTDRDGISNFEYYINDSSNGSLAWSINGVGSPKTTLLHSIEKNQISEYTLRINATDSFGAVRHTEIPVIVENTKEGPLYVNEYWSDEHVIVGYITVPEGITLTIADNTSVKVDTNPSNGYNQTITIEENAFLNHLGAVRYYNDSVYGNWGGLVIKGHSNLSNLIIDKANRGIVLDSGSDFEILDSRFNECIIGAHLVNAGTVEIKRITFRNNEYYGIKEDNNVNPIVTDSIFTGNGYDYYDSDLTVLGADELNEIDTNIGNQGE